MCITGCEQDLKTWHIASQWVFSSVGGTVYYLSTERYLAVLFW